jgi:hypothetical protein
MAHVNDREVFLNRARECESLAATTAESPAKDILRQMADGYWIMLSATNACDERIPSQRRAPDS